MIRNGNIFLVLLLYFSSKIFLIIQNVLIILVLIFSKELFIILTKKQIILEKLILLFTRFVLIVMIFILV